MHMYQFLSKAEVQQTSDQPLFTSTIQERRLHLFRHIAQLDDSADANTAFSPETAKTPSDHMDEDSPK